MRFRPTMIGLLAGLAIAPALAAAPVDFDPEHVALAFHKVSGEALDLEGAARVMPAYYGAPNFDKPEVLSRLVGELEKSLEGTDAGQEFVIRVNNDSIGEYDHGLGEFSIGNFDKGTYVPFSAFNRNYKLVFANAEGSRAIRMTRDDARAFDEVLRAMHRQVTTEVHFRVIGSGDPTGTLTVRRGYNEHVVRAEVLGARVLDRQQGRVLHVAAVVPVGQEPATASPPRPVIPPLTPSNAEVAGFRVSVPAATLVDTLERTYGPVRRGSPPSDADPRITGLLEVNQLACRSIPGRHLAVGTVCVTALVDEDDIVRSIKVERVFPRVETEALRTAMLARYGATADAQSPALAWGPIVEPRLLATQPGTHALTASASALGSSVAGGRASYFNVNLVLSDAAWANGGK